MSHLEMLRVFVNERLNAAAEEIFGVFVRTVTEYEDQLSRSKQENERQHKLLDVLLNPDVRLNRTALSEGVQQDVEPPKLNNDLLWSNEEAKQPEPISGGSDVEEDTARSSFLYQRNTRGDRETADSSLAQPTETNLKHEDDGRSEPGSKSDFESFLPPAHDTETGIVNHSDIDSNRHTEPQLKVQENQSVGHTCNSDNKCSGCGKALEQEMQSFIKDPSGELLCSICVEGPTQSSSLLAQQRTYSGTNIFTCSVCKSQFSTKSVTVRHIRTHTGEKPFGCSVCGQRFNQSTDLETHMRIHTGERPFSCLICHKHFMRSGILARHMRVHTGEKPYSCSVCNTSFTLSQSLSKHMRIHTGEKPFSCTVCGKKFTQKGHLTQHMPLHTGERLFSCHICGKHFSRRSRVKKHKCVTDSSSKT